MSKFMISASLAIVAVNAFAAIEQKVDVAAVKQSDAAVVARLDTLLTRREVGASVSAMCPSLMSSLAKDGASLMDQFGKDAELIAWGDDSAGGALRNVCYGNCYTNCYGNCHSACHFACFTSYCPECGY